VALDVSIEGAAEFRRVAQQMRAQGRRDLSRQMADALTRAARPVEDAIDREAIASMPSGYRAALSASLEHRQARRTGSQQARLLLRTFAEGQVKRRDLPALNAGKLRHPLYGKRGQTWYVTAVRPGFHERGAAHAMDEVRPELRKVVREFAQKLIE
jgi:hypothetical protein